MSHTVISDIIDNFVRQRTSVVRHRIFGNPTKSSRQLGIFQQVALLNQRAVFLHEQLPAEISVTVVLDQYECELFDRMK